MYDLRVRLVHSHIQAVSDRTARSISKHIAQRLREIQRSEVQHLIQDSHLPEKRKQSLRDRLDPQLQGIPAYYIRNLATGSLVLEVSLAAGGLWLLQKTFGESIKEAWLRTSMHAAILRFLTGDQEDEASSSESPHTPNDEPASRFNSEREEFPPRVDFVRRELEESFGEGTIFKRFIVDRLQFESLYNDIYLFTVYVATPPGTDLEERLIDVELVRKEGQRLLAIAEEEVRRNG